MLREIEEEEQRQREWEEEEKRRQEQILKEAKDELEVSYNKSDFKQNSKLGNLIIQCIFACLTYRLQNIALRTTLSL